MGTERESTLIIVASPTVVTVIVDETTISVVTANGSSSTSLPDNGGEIACIAVAGGAAVGCIIAGAASTLELEIPLNNRKFSTASVVGAQVPVARFGPAAARIGPGAGAAARVTAAVLPEHPMTTAHASVVSTT